MKRCIVELLDTDGRIRYADLNISIFDDTYIFYAACSQLNVQPEDVDDWSYHIYRNLI